MIKEKRRVALVSVFAAVLLTGMKLGVGMWTGSLGILSEAAHSGLDLVAAVITFFAIRVADRPPDEKHNYGHGKVENLSALAETILLFVTCIWILYEAYERLFVSGTHIEVNVWSFIVIGTSIAVDFGRSRALYRTARKYNSQALEADGLHFRTDIYSSLVVIVGLGCVKLGFPQGDALSAVIVAVIVIWISMRLGKRTIDVLLDTRPAEAENAVREALHNLEGVERVRSLRVRQSGAQTFIDLVIDIDRTYTFDHAHDLMSGIESELHARIPNSDVMVHSEPVERTNETVSAKIGWLAQRYGVSTHNVAVLAIDEKYHVDMDIEYQMGTTFKQAHTLATHLESDILASMPEVRDVCIHLEEDAGVVVSSENVSDRENSLINTIREIAGREERIRETGSVECYSNFTGLQVSIICSMDGALTLKEVHNTVDRLEKEIMALDGRITKVFIHAEPA